MESELGPWVELLNSLDQDAVNLTVGLISGCRQGNQRAVLDRLAEASLDPVASRQLSNSSVQKSLGPAGPTLLIRLNLGDEALPKRQLRTARSLEQPPTPIVSPLGKWREVCVSLTLGLTACPSLQRLPRWLAGWKRDYRRILVDLGPLDQPVCRGLGRYCDATLLLLGPETCASPTWLRKHIDHLTQCDARLSGSILISTRAA